MRFNKAKKSIPPNEILKFNFEFERREWGAEYKIDGARYRIIKDHPQRKARIFSKRVSVVTGELVEKTENFPQFSFQRYGGTFDIEVEMIVGDGSNCSSKLVTSVSGSLPDKAITLQEEGGYLNACIIDIHSFNGEKFKTQREKNRVIHNIEDGLNEYVMYGAKLYTPPQYSVNSNQDILVTFNKAVEEGYEGLMLKCYDEKETWYKVKKEDEWDFVILGFEESKSDDFQSRGWIGSIIYGYIVGELTNNSVADPTIVVNRKELEGITKIGSRIFKTQECGTTAGIDFQLREEISSNPEKYVGKVIKIAGQEISKNFSIRHPRFDGFHNDKSFLEITKEDLKRRIKE